MESERKSENGLKRTNLWYKRTRAEANESHKNNCVLKSTQNAFKYHFDDDDDDDGESS